MWDSLQNSNPKLWSVGRAALVVLPIKFWAKVGCIAQRAPSFLMSPWAMHGCFTFRSLPAAGPAVRGAGRVVTWMDSHLLLQ